MGAAPTSIPNRLARGEAADVVILARTALDALAKDGKIVRGSEADLADSRIGMAVKAGESKPDISTVDQFRRVLLGAKSIAYSESASGVYISTEMFKKLGIADQVSTRAKMISGRPVAEAVAAGEAEIGFQQISELLPVAGASFVGPIPDAVQSITTFSAGIPAASTSRTAARQLIEHLASAQARETIRKTGLDPVKTPHQIAFTRVFPNAGQIGLFVASADGSGERQLFDSAGFDYDATWSPDGTTIVYTSDREGSPDLFRIKPDGTGRERLTDDPAYDDQAAFSPDGAALAFVSTRNGGYARIWTLDLRSRQVRAVTTTTQSTGMGGDFRPSWSPDGKWIAFSSDRGTTMKMARGRWEALQPADIYVVRPDGTGLKRVSTPGNFCGSPKFSSDGTRLLAYCMPLESTLETRRPNPLPGNDTTLVSIDIATGKATDIPSGPGVKISPAFLPGSDIGYVRKDSGDAGIYYTSGKRGPRGNVRMAAWSPDGSRVVFHRRQTAPPTSWLKGFTANPKYEIAFSSVLPSFSPSGDQFVMVGRPEGANALGSTIQVGSPGVDANRTIYKDAARNVLGPQWSPDGKTILFGVGTYQAFFNGFVSRIMSHDDRIEGGAQIAMIDPEGGGFREITSGVNNNGFPSMAPDGKRIVYRTFGPDGEGLRIMNIETRAVTTLTSGYDNFPIWSPRGDRIVFSRVADGDYEIYTIAPDGTGLKRLTSAIGNDAHQGWSPDGEHIVFASSRMGFKDEGAYTDAPQPYGELFVMRADGTGVEQLTDNQWEEGAPAWRPRR
jgi:Tol biopolymer transport system component/ABC-type molybdate transport system substrate-binding protein